MVGGVVCVAGLVLVSPLVHGLELGGATFLIAAYPILLDLLLTGVIVGQVGLGRRPLTWAGLAPAAGFLAIAVGDFGTFLAATSGTYDLNPWYVIFYGVGFTAVVLGASLVRRSAPTGVRENRGTDGFQAVAGALAVSLLVLRPATTGEWYVTLPAVLTLAAAAARQILALKTARSATEARRLALTDDLTGLPNRRAILTHLATAIGTRSSRALLLLDIDNFKDVNDSLGHRGRSRSLPYRRCAGEIVRILGHHCQARR